MNKIKNFFESGKMLSRAVATMVVLATLVFCFSKISTAKMTYTITDADNTTVIESTSDDMESIISDAGIVLTDNDSYVMNKVGSTSYEISILRFKQVELYYGEYHVETLTQCATVGELLDKMGIDTEKISAINHGTDKEIYDGMTIRIAYAEVEEQSSEETEVSSATVEVEPEPQEESYSDGSYLQYGSIYDAEDGSNTITTASGEVISYSYAITAKATAYTTERQSNKITATGTIARVGAIAVDPSVIPYGTRMYIVASDGTWIYGYATAEDCGGSVKGNYIDLFFDTYDECIQFGVRTATVYILS